MKVQRTFVSHKQTKLVHLDEVLCKRFAAVHSKGKPMTGPMIIEKPKSSYNENK
jgi:hypothetical protein